MASEAISNTPMQNTSKISRSFSVNAISVILISWNNESHLANCLQSLDAQKFQDFEIAIIDNGSTDNSLLIVENYQTKLRIKIIKQIKNIGFTVANNIGVHLAKTKWIVLLNADAYPEPDWLEQLIKAADENPQYNFFSSRQIQYNSPHLLDGAGDEYHVSGLAWRRYYNYTKEFGIQQGEVFGACAAAAMYRREDFLKVGGFDEDYFSYFEDVDLSFRLRLAGGRCLYVPQAVVHHVGSASTGKLSDFVIYHGHRNLVWTYFKNMPTLLFWFFLPLHLIMNLFFLVSFTLKGKGSAIFMAKRDAILGILRVLKKRKEIQETRSVSFIETYRLMSRGLLEPCWASRQRKMNVDNKKG